MGTKKPHSLVIPTLGKQDSGYLEFAVQPGLLGKGSERPWLQRKKKRQNNTGGCPLATTCTWTNMHVYMYLHTPCTYPKHTTHIHLHTTHIHTTYHTHHTHAPHLHTTQHMHIYHTYTHAHIHTQHNSWLTGKSVLSHWRGRKD